MSDAAASSPSRGRLLVAALVAAAFAAGWGAHALSVRAEERRVADAARAEGAGFEIELFARTPQRPAESALCLLDGQYGLVAKGGGVSNRNSHLDFHHYQAGAFTAGIQGGDVGQVIDLGDAELLAREHGRPPLEALRWREGELVVEGGVVLTPGAPGPSDARRWVARVLKAPKIADADKSAQVKPGHVYFVRIIGTRAPLEIAALLQVLEYDVGSRVKLRCVQL